MENTYFQLQFLSFSLTLSLAIQISRLVYTNGGDAILVLISIHFLWKWPQDLNYSGVVKNDMLYNSFLLDFSSISFRIETEVTVCHLILMMLIESRQLPRFTLINGNQGVA